MKWINRCVFIAMALLLVGCTQEMMDQARYEPLEPTDFFKDGRSSRPLVEGTVARGQLRLDTHLFEGIVNDEFVDEFPFPITREVIERGRERYDIFCAVCHDRTGAGNGMVVQRGFTRPPSLHENRLREASLGYQFHIITKGIGDMAGMARQIPANDRWAIVAYIKALQRSQNATLRDVPTSERGGLLKQAKVVARVNATMPRPEKTLSLLLSPTFSRTMSSRDHFPNTMAKPIHTMK